MARLPEYCAVDEKPEDEIALDIFDVIKGIKDPEKPQTLEELDVLSEESVKAEKLSDTLLHATELKLTSLLRRGRIPRRRMTAAYYEYLVNSIVNKQINDKERVAAAMENPNLLELIDSCIDER